MAYVFLVRERVGEVREGGDFESFERSHPDLFAWPDGALARYYTDETLRSDAARRAFVLPDRLVTC